MKISLRHFLFSSLSIWFAVTLFGGYFIYHEFQTRRLHPGSKFLNFGVDLVGGTYLELDVKMDKAVELELLNRLQMIVEKLKQSNQEAPAISVEKETGILTFTNDEAARKAEEALIDKNIRYALQREGNKITTVLSPEETATVKHEALVGNIQVLDRRLNPTGASEITIVPQGDRRIIVELPNVHNIQQAKAMIGKTALLEIKLVEDTGASESELLAKYGGKLPDNLMIAPGSERRSGAAFYVVPKYTDLTGRLLKDAQSDIDETGESIITFAFRPEGGDKFYELTSKNIGRNVAILIDNVVITAPVVQSAISDHGQIKGSFTPESAQQMAALLKSGAFVAPVTFEQERHIGPALGAQSIKNGLIACLIGMLLLLLFSLFVYKTAGLLAFIVLLYNLLLILFAFSALKATLTLPGIAGMLLTIGMAIDASILIYERVREELAVGVPLRKAIDTGFSGAMAVILDANITHFLVSLVLYYLGAGPIRGFAVAMIIGILSTLITGLLLLKSIFNFVIDGLGVREIKF